MIFQILFWRYYYFSLNSSVLLVLLIINSRKYCVTKAKPITKKIMQNINTRQKFKKLKV